MNQTNKEHMLRLLMEHIDVCYRSERTRVEHQKDWQQCAEEQREAAFYALKVLSESKDVGELQEYEIWCEGFKATGEYGLAHLVGKMEAPSFLEACLQLARKKEIKLGLNKGLAPAIWGCRLYDNEQNARSTFG